MLSFAFIFDVKVILASNVSVLTPPGQKWSFLGNRFRYRKKTHFSSAKSRFLPNPDSWILNRFRLMRNWRKRARSIESLKPISLVSIVQIGLPFFHTKYKLSIDLNRFWILQSSFTRILKTKVHVVLEFQNRKTCPNNSHIVVTRGLKPVWLLDI